MPDAEPFESEHSFRALADATPQIVWVILPDGRVEYLNRRGREYFGTGPEDLPADWARVVHPDDISSIRRSWRTALESGTNFEEAFQLKGRNGTYRWHLGRAVPVRNDEGEITHWCGTSTDIHELKRTQINLEERQQLFRTMADTAPVLIWLTADDQAYTYFNKGWLNFTGRALDDELGFGWSEGIHPDDVDRRMKIFTEAFDAREPFRMEYRLRRHDGEYRWILDHGAPICDAVRGFTGYIGSCIDIHERRQLEDQIRFLAEASPILTSSLDYESTLQTVAQFMVPQLADWCTVDMLTPDGGIELVAIAHVDPAKIQFGRELRKRYPVDMDAPHGIGNVIRTGDSELYPEITDEMLEYSARDEAYLDIVRSVGFKSALIVPLRARGHTLGTLTLVWTESGRHYTESDLHFAEELARRAAIVVDNARLYKDARVAREELEQLNATLEARVVERTTELSIANEQLRGEVKERERAQFEMSRLNRLLEHKNRELQDFAHVASHDLQEPLRKILSFSSLLNTEYGDELDDAALYLERIEDAAERMMRLIHDLLSFSRVATAGEAFRKVHLATVIDEVLSDLDFRIEETEGQILVRDMCTIEADPLQMRLLFQNLIGNALKFHREGEPPTIEIRSRTDGSDCIIQVEDNGIGFEDEYVERIFSPFQRLHSRSEYPGTGMGLAICRRIVERHEGILTAHGRPGVGSTFEARLPLAQSSARS